MCRKGILTSEALDALEDATIAEAPGTTAASTDVVGITNLSSSEYAKRISTLNRALHVASFRSLMAILKMKVPDEHRDLQHLVEMVLQEASDFSRHCTDGQVCVLKMAITAEAQLSVAVS